MIGNKAFIVAVQPGSDAEAKGLQPGDRMISLEGVTITRKNLPSLQYIFYLLAPRTAMNMQIEKPNGQRRELSVEARVFEGKIITSLETGMASDRYDLIREAQTLARLYRHRYYEFGDEAMIWKMPQFDLSEAEVNDLMDKARKRKALVLDLRSNGALRVKTAHRQDTRQKCFHRNFSSFDRQRFWFSLGSICAGDAVGKAGRGYRRSLRRISDA